MFTLMFRAVVIYAIVLFVIRIMGKRQIGDMQPFELVITLIIADLACIPMAESTIPIVYGIVPLLTLCVLHFFVSVLCRKSMLLRKIFNGKPVIVINNDGIDYNALKSLNMTLNDLCEGLRKASCFDFDSVAFAIVETNGNINVLLKSQAAPVTVENLKLKTEEADLQIIIVNDGKISNENLQTLNLKESFVYDILKKEKVKNIKDVLILCTSGKGQYFFQLKNQPCKIIAMEAKK